jgi:2,5-diketo-D-gluconate reductase B
MEDLIVQGLRLPRLGLGTFRMSGAVCRAAVESALALGYRHIDTAEMYGNEDVVGEALAATAVPRGDIHLTTKVSNTNLAPDAMRRSFEASLAKLKTDYVDLYLIHWPAPGMDLPKALETMLKLKEQGGTRGIGVCNFPLALLRQAVEEVGAPIVCDQIEYHVLLDQTTLCRYAAAHGIVITAYCPLARGNLIDSPELVAIGAKHGATASQVALAWLLGQDGVAAIPKAAHAAHQKTNLEAMQLRLDDADRAVIAALPKDQRVVNPSIAPAWDPPVRI